MWTACEQIFYVQQFLNSVLCTVLGMGRVAQSVQRLATGRMVRGSNPGGDEIFHTCPDRPWGPNSLMGTRFFPGVKSGRGVTLTPHPLLVQLVIKEQSYTSTPTMGRTACTRVRFTFTLRGTYFLSCSICSNYSLLQVFGSLNGCLFFRDV